MPAPPISDIAFTPAVKAIQERKGPRRGYARMDEKGGWADAITPDLAAFIAERDSFYLATASADGQPYIQHRGGKAGFLKMLDAHTLAFADFKGNRQYITSGNLLDNDKAYIFLMDYANRRRVKIWGTARVVEDDPALDDLSGVGLSDDYHGRPLRLGRPCFNLHEHFGRFRLFFLHLFGQIALLLYVVFAWSMIFLAVMV